MVIRLLERGSVYAVMAAACGASSVSGGRSDLEGLVKG